MDSGVRNPERNTPSPSRVTSRSSWIARRRPRVRRAIFSRTELEPISTAAKVGMRQGQQFTCRMGLRHQKAKSKIFNPGDTGTQRRNAGGLRIAPEHSLVGIFFSPDQAAVAVLGLASTGVGTEGMAA